MRVCVCMSGHSACTRMIGYSARVCVCLCVCVGTARVCVCVCADSLATETHTQSCHCGCQGDRPHADLSAFLTFMAKLLSLKAEWEAYLTAGSTPGVI